MLKTLVVSTVTSACTAVVTLVLAVGLYVAFLSTHPRLIEIDPMVRTNLLVVYDIDSQTPRVAIGTKDGYGTGVFVFDEHGKLVASLP